MSPQLLRVLVAVLLSGHGLGHALTGLPLLGFRLSQTHSTDSWLLGGLVGSQGAAAICVTLNLLALIGFVCSGLGVAGWGVPREAWTRLALGAACVSLVALVAFWNAYPFLFPNKVGVLVVDLWAISSVLWFQWPQALFDG